MRKSIAIIGGGAAALAFASFINTERYDVTIYEKNKALGRKFLVAGKGGFNLTHSQAISTLKGKYTPEGFLDRCLDTFTNTDFRKWLDEIGIPTYIGSSGRIFPIQGIKPIEVLQNILQHIKNRGVVIKTDYEWKGERLADVMVYALGGASWPVTGSDGSWIQYFEEALPFYGVNCAVRVEWPKSTLQQVEGKPLKNIGIEYKNTRYHGEAVITKFGLEGGVIYQHSLEIRSALNMHQSTTIYLDLKKDLSEQQILLKLKQSGEKTLTSTLKRDLKLSKASIELLKGFVSKDDFLHKVTLAQCIKKLPILVTDMAPIDEAISTIGGIPIDSLTSNFELSDIPDHYCIGEMVNWHAPTGGYLLQGCFSMGYFLATNLSARHP
ncbi:TIGR03862 family flavoprotein [Portibacter marinus]|uniref:TIGR03862 family flavoprotein n=1 Tax=Portibacter marinus TaxID=2898660 RepID=UPI001F373D1C|nr:TIGR03862 family flavoprotein [Portibacter marinus]